MGEFRLTTGRFGGVAAAVVFCVSPLSVVLETGGGPSVVAATAHAQGRSEEARDNGADRGNSGDNPAAGSGGNSGGNAGGNSGGNAGGNSGGNAGGNSGGNAGGNSGGNAGGNSGGNSGGNAGGNAGGNSSASRGGDASAAAQGSGPSGAASPGVDAGPGGMAEAASSGLGGPVRIIRVQTTSGGIEIVYADGSVEEIANGRYLRRDIDSRRVEERYATGADVARLRAIGNALAVPARTRAGDEGGDRPRRIERDGADIEVTYANGWREAVEAGRYLMKDRFNRTVVNRPATAEDRARLDALVPPR